MCNCKATEIILAIVILVFAIWPTQIISAVASRWVVIVATVLLLIHAFGCNDVSIRGVVVKPVKRRVVGKTKKKKRRR